MRCVASVITHPDKVVGEQTSASAQLALPPPSIVLPYVHDDIAHRQAQLIVLLSLIVELHHGLHCAQRARESWCVTTRGCKRSNSEEEPHCSIFTPWWRFWIFDDCASFIYSHNWK